jgi:hypothetical protein
MIEATPWFREILRGAVCGRRDRAAGAIAADLTSGGSIVPLQRSPRSGIREKEIGDIGRRRSGGRCGSVGASRARKATEQGDAAPRKASVTNWVDDPTVPA